LSAECPLPPAHNEISQEFDCDIDLETSSPQNGPYNALNGDDKSNRPKRKRHVLDPSSSLFDIATVLPNSGETEWNPANRHHSGNWPMEEEKFANRLVLEFEAGVLEDCKEGTTLQS
jgi:hypothetical protein